MQRNNHANLQLNNNATLQRNNHATLQRNNHATLHLPNYDGQNLPIGLRTHKRVYPSPYLSDKRTRILSIYWLMFVSLDSFVWCP
jgi:hypothetical protein